MPKLKESENAKKNRYLKAEIEKGMSLFGKSKKDIAQLLCLAPSTVYYRLKNPGTFTLDELRILVKTLHIDTNIYTTFI